MVMVMVLGVVLSSHSPGDGVGIGGPANGASGSSNIVSPRDTDGDGGINLADPDDDDSNQDTDDVDRGHDDKGGDS